MKKRKTKTVRVLAQVVNSDRIPVNGAGVEYGRGWRQNTEMVTRRIRVKSPRRI